MGKAELMKTVSENICEIITIAKPKILEIPQEGVRHKVRLDTWSKQEILGHLIDSALNNHQRFVRGALNVAEDFPTYNQDRWVEIQRYNEMDWADLVDLLVQCNFHLCRVLDCLPEEALENPCNTGKESPVALGLVIGDYLRHLKLHMGQILESLA